MPIITPEYNLYNWSDLNFPTIEPSLRLDFANARALDPRITFTRASVGTYVDANGLIKTAGEDEARFDHDPATGESLGLLIEESRTNYQTYSVDINTGKSFLTGSTLSSNVAIAPDGTTTATRITGSGIDEITRLGWNTQGTSNTQYNLFSVFVKANSGTPILGFYSNTFVAGAVAFNIDLSDGSTNTISGSGSFSSKVVAYPNGWYRVTVMGGPGTGSSGSWNINLVPSLTSERGSQSGSNASASYFIWGVQEELTKSGFFPTSYIPTNGSTVTRAVEYAYSDTNGFLNPEAGTIISKFKWLDLSTPGTFGKVLYSFNQSTGGFGNGIYISNEPLQTATNFKVMSGSSAVAAEALLQLGQDPAELNIAIGYETNNVGFCEGGGSISEDTSADIPNIERLVIGNNAWGNGVGGSNGSNPANCHIKSFIYYPKRLANAQLKALTQ